MIRHVLAALTITATLLAVPALAQELPDPNADKSSWVLGYALVILGIALGLVAVCRPGNRSSEVRLDDD